MTGKRDWLILVAILGMDLSWLYGWASLIMLSSFNQPFSQMTILGVACLATLLTLSHHRRGWRYYQIGGAHLVGLFLACAALIYGMGDSAHSFLDAAWIKEFFTTPRTPVGWLMQAIALFWCLAFWITATRLAVLPRNYITVSNHFDFGVIALVLLHLIEVLISVEGGITLTELSLPRLLFSFFVFSIPAFCLTRCGGRKRFYYRLSRHRCNNQFPCSFFAAGQRCRRSLSTSFNCRRRDRRCCFENGYHSDR